MIMQIYSIIRNNIRLLFISNIIILLIGLVLCFVLPEKYKAVGIFVRKEEESLNIKNMISQFSPGLMGVQSSQYETNNITETRWLMDKVIEEEDLMEYYSLESKSDVYGMLTGNITVEDKRDGMTTVSFSDRDPQKAASICNAIIKYIDKFRQKMEKSTLDDYQLFLEKTADEIEMEIGTVKDSIVILTRKYGLWVDLNEELRIPMGRSNSIRDSIMIKEMQYQYFKEQNPNSEYAKNTKKELEFLYKQWESIYTEGYKFTDDNYIIPPFKDAPEIILSFHSLNAELRIKQLVYKMIMSEYYSNLFKINKQVPQIKIIDQAIPPSKRDFPKRKLLILGFLLIIFVLDVLFVQYRLSHNTETK